MIESKKKSPDAVHSFHERYYSGGSDNFGADKVHFGGEIHMYLAQTMFFFIQAVATGAKAMSPVCKVSSNSILHTPSEKVKIAREHGTDPASSLFCSRTLSDHDSTRAYHKLQKQLHERINNNAGGSDGVSLSGIWNLLEDRPGKYGWIAEPSTEPRKQTRGQDIVMFPVQLSHSGFITFEYMHSYENAGKVLLSLTQASHEEDSPGSIHCEGTNLPLLSPGANF